MEGIGHPNGSGCPAPHLENAVIEGLDFDEETGAVVISVRPVAKARHRAGAVRDMTEETADGAGGAWIWDLSGLPGSRCPRVACRTHGSTVAAVSPKAVRNTLFFRTPFVSSFSKPSDSSKT